MMHAAASRSYLKVSGPDPTHEELLRHFTGHLVDEELNYFCQWDRLIDLEADASASFIARSWLVESLERETTTLNSVSSLVFDKAISSPQAVFDNSWMATIGFRRCPASTLRTPLAHVGLAPGSRVVVSADTTSVGRQRQRNRAQYQMHIVRGVVQAVTESHLTVLASRDDLIRIERTVNRSSFRHFLFRIDKDDGATGTGTLRQNLVNLFTADVKSIDEPGTHVSQSRLSWLRDVLIRLRQPIFDETLPKSMFTPPFGSSASEVPGCDLMDLCFEYSTLNPDQKAAAGKVRYAAPHGITRFSTRLTVSTHSRISLR
jgi:hypothetical protein